MDADIHADLCAHPRLAVYLMRELAGESVTTTGTLYPQSSVTAEKWNNRVWVSL